MLRSPYSPPALMLVLLMAVGSIVMWIGVPLGLVYAASQLADSSRPSVLTTSAASKLSWAISLTSARSSWARVISGEASRW